MDGSTAVGFSYPAGGNVSSEWGYDGGGLNSGALQNTANTVNTAVSSMESQTTAQFAPGSIADPINLDGPDFGLISDLETGGLGVGVEGIRDSIRIVLNLTKSNGGNWINLVSGIDASWVALTFGSPGSTSVADASNTCVLLGFAMLGVEGIRRRLTRRSR